MCEGKEGGGGGMMRAKTVLGGCKGEGIKFREEKAFEHLNRGA